MGNSNSAELLEVPLQSPAKPTQALDIGWVTETPTQLHIETGAGANATVTDSATKQVVYTFRDKFSEPNVLLKDPQDQTLITIKRSGWTGKCRIFEGDQTETQQFVIDDTSSTFDPMLLVAEFVDRKTGTECRVAVEGEASTEVVLCYLERGSPFLSLLEKSKHFRENRDQYQPVGRIAQTHSGFTHKEYSIEAAASVDLTLLLLMWHVRYEYLRREGSSTSAAVNSSVAASICAS